MWACAACTLENEDEATECSLCNTEAPKRPRKRPRVRGGEGAQGGKEKKLKLRKLRAEESSKGGRIEGRALELIDSDENDARAMPAPSVPCSRNVPELAR
ncbi:unnamed protein product, partial [Chrysoparadoxa australica]